MIAYDLAPPSILFLIRYIGKYYTLRNWSHSEKIYLLRYQIFLPIDGVFETFSPIMQIVYMGLETF